MAADKSIQSLDRGLQVLRLLSRTPVMTATAIAAELEIHQSSASRLLNSLLKAGFVRKPDFHSFALDYGALAFAGHAFNCFPEIRACTAACNRINSEYGFSAAAGILREGRVLYLTQISGSAAISILDDSEFPLHQSSLGLILACEKQPPEAVELIADSIRRFNGFMGLSETEKKVCKQAEVIYQNTMDNIYQHDFFYQTDSPLNKINGAQTFSLNSEHAAVAIYHGSRDASVGQMRQMLKDAIKLINNVLKPPQ